MKNLVKSLVLVTLLGTAGISNANPASANACGAKHGFQGSAYVNCIKDSKGVSREKPVAPKHEEVKAYDPVEQYLMDARDGKLNHLSGEEILTRAYKIAETLPNTARKAEYLSLLQAEHIKLTGRRIGEKPMTWGESTGVDEVLRLYGAPPSTKNYNCRGDRYQVRCNEW